MRTVTIVLLAALALASACATSTFAQDSVSDRIEALEAELRDLGERAAEIEAELTTLRAIAAGAGEAIREARANDEEHEFITYPVYQFHNDDLHVMLHRIGYVTYHDAEHRIPRWVSQKLTKEHVNASSAFSRRPSWKTDPELSGVGATDTDYRHSQYDRGHLAMQATLRGRVEQCEREGMYFANAAPQRHSFNAGIWLRLENQVINWAREHNEVWMICGPVLQEHPPTLKDAGRVSIPSMFYKIVSRDTEEGVAVIAFMFEHEPDEPHGDLEDYIVSIRYIEDWTGINFFSDLPQEIQDVLETKRYSMNFDGTAVAGDEVLHDDPHDTDLVYVTGSGTRYHRQGCRFVKEGAAALPLDEAMATHHPCAVCRPQH